MKKYEKIKSVLKREGDIVKLEFPNLEFMLLQDIYWEFTEKIDGTNIRICWDGYNISFAGRTEKSKIPPHLLKVLEETYNTNAFEEMIEQKFGDKEVIFFGEGCGEKIQTNGEKYGKPHFVLFDICVNGKYLERKNFYEVANYFKMETAPALFTGSLLDGIDFVEQEPKSVLGDLEMEGVVGRPVIELQNGNGERIITKIRVRDVKNCIENGIKAEKEKREERRKEKCNDDIEGNAKT